MQEFVLTDAADQEFTTLIAGQRCTFRFRYNVTSDRWSFDMKIGETQVITGRRVVLGIDLIKPFCLGVGAIFAVDYEGNGNAPDRTAIPERRVRIYQADPEELVA